MKDLGADVQDVFAGMQTIVYLQKGVELDEKAVTAALDKHKIKMTSMTRDDEEIL